MIKQGFGKSSKGNIMVLVFDVEHYERRELDGMTGKELYERALSDDEHVSIYDDLDTFQEDLNDECVNVDGSWIYFVERD